MKYKKRFIFICLIICLFSIASVCAAEVNETAVTNEDQSENILEIENHDNLDGSTLENVNENIITESQIDLLKNNPKTFNVLNATINGNDDRDIYLDSNYTFELDTDNNFKDGIKISRAVTIHGNGYTIDGNNSARIFTVTNSNVVFKDIIFINANSTSIGGAILFSSSGSAVNCTFSFNSAGNYGGAMYGGSAVNCTFSFNSAGNYGGAIMEGSAVNCTFISNSAKDHAGAMYDSSAVNCTFISNSASNCAGAIEMGSAVNCTFNNNSARTYGGAIKDVSAVNCTFNSNNCLGEGGAMYGGSAVNCTFNNNSVRNYGGAMYGGSAVNCTFNNNSVRNFGGAMYGGSAVNCTFSFNSGSFGGAMYGGSAMDCIFNNNSAENGGAMYYGSAVNCNFTNNKANQNGGAMYGEGYTAINCQFTNNTAINGGATYKIYADNSEFTKNTAIEYGGAMYEGVVTNSNFTQNYANKEGGAVYGISASNCLFEYNIAENGGAISRGRAKNCTFYNNNATNYGGAAYSAEVSTNSKFNNNIAFNGTATDNVTWFNQVNAKSFFELNETINNNTETDIYLNYNYTYDFAKDFNFKNGIAINRAVTIHGNGYTIDGDNAVRIFKVTNDYVIFMDIVFVNGKTTGYGGAINGKCTAINCSFSFNSAGSYGGGAMYGGSAVNCSFSFNSAGSYGGGAMYGGSAVNCTFINNAATENGGAIMEGSAVNCTFINNSAKNAGAMYGGSAVNCTFISNSVKNTAGAMYGGSAVNCTFISNSAKSSAGAMYGGSAVNCTFVNNTAVTSAGAIYSVEAINSTFIGNSATWQGGAMREGKAINCTFRENNANFGGAINDGQAINSIFIENLANIGFGAMYGGTADTCIFKTSSDEYNGTTILSPILTVNNFTSTYNSGEKLNFDLKTNSGMNVNNGNITIILYKNNSWFGNFSCLSGEGWIVDLPAGSYLAIFYTEYEGYTPVNATIIIIKKDSTLNVNNFTFDYNSTGSTEVSYTGATGVVAEVINHDEANITITNNIITVSNLNAGNYTLKVTTIPDANHTAVTKTANITVNKVDSSVSLDNIVFNYNDKGNATVSLNGASGVEASIEDFPDALIVEGMVITVSGLDAGNYTLTVTTVPDGDHNSVTKTVNVTVNKIDSDLSVDNVAMDYGGSKNVDVATEGSIGVIAKIDDVNVAVVDNFTILISGLNAGNHNLTVTTIPDANHKSVTKAVNITVNKADAQVVISDFTGTVGYELTLSVNVISSNNLTINEGVVSFFDGELNIGEADVIEGVATITYTPKKYGKFNISAIFNDSSNYLKSDNTSEININKANVEVTIEEIDDVYYSVPSKFTVKVFSNSKEVNEGIVKFYINDTEVGYSNVKNGVSTFEYICPNAGTFDIIVIFEESENYLSNNTQTNLTINKMPTFIRCESETIGDEKLFSIELVDINGKGIFNESVGLILSKSPGEIKLLNNISDSEGIVTYSLSDLSGGVWSISCNHKESENYLASSDANKFVLIKIKTSTVINQLDEVYINEGVNLSFDIYDEFGNIIKVGIAHLFINDEIIGEFNFDNHSVTDYLNNRTIDFSQDSNLFLEYIALINGSYSFKVLFGGNDLYESSNQNITFDANVPQPIDEKDIDVPSLDDATGGTVSVKLPSDATGTITLNINGKNYTFDVVNGVANVILPDLVDGAYSYSIIYSGDSKYSSFTKTGNLTIERITVIVVSNVNTVYNGGKYLVATLKDINGNIISGVKLTVVLNGKTYTPTTDANGQVRLSTNGLAPKVYTATITFAGNTNLAKSTKTAKITVKKATPKLIALKKTFKRTIKVKNYVVALKTNQNKVMKNTWVTLTINKKIFKAKTNAKGQAIFKITNLNKKGNFIATVKYAGNTYYNSKLVKQWILVR